jgi:DHA3 family macrolide efflux protein-like MFS transporter
LIRAVLALLLIVSTQVWHVYIVLGALSCVSAFFAPAQTVTIRTHVPTEGLVSSNALMQMAFMGSRVVGPVAAGAIVAAFGPAICYMLDVLSFVASAMLIGSVAIQRALAPQTLESSSNRIHAIWIDMRAGASFIFHHAAILFVILAMAAGLFTIGCFAPLISIWVRDTLHANARVFGVVSGSVGIGMLVGTQPIRRLSTRIPHDVLVLSGLAGIGAAVLLLGALPFVAAAIGATFMIGFSFAAIMIPAQTLTQRETPHDMLGRVASTQISILFLAQILGLVLSGALAELFGVRLVFFGCAVLSLALVVVGRLFLHAKAQA